MIRETLQRTKESTFIVHTLDEDIHSMPTPSGTGFFISSDGYFITANHVIEDAEYILLNQPMGKGPMPVMGPPELQLIEQWDEFDIALLKADYFKLKTRTGHESKSKDFSYLEIDFKEQEEGSPVYSYGFPSSYMDTEYGGKYEVGWHYYYPRTTSAIISSWDEVIGPNHLSAKSKYYVIDKALNYGNSGAPIIITETGKVISVYTEFHLVGIPQNLDVAISDEDSRNNRDVLKLKELLKKLDFKIDVPSLYCITSSLCNIKDDLNDFL